MSDCKVTTGITAYREGALLLRAWESVLHQTNANWRAVIVLDGGADEETVALFDSIIHPHLIKFKAERNQGPYASRTKAIELTETEWFYFLDGDDALPGDAINVFYDSIGESYDFLCGQVLLVHPDSHEQIIDVPEISIKEVILDNRYPSLVAFRKEMFTKVGGYCKELMRGRADFDFFLSLIENKARYVYVKRLVYHYFLRKNSVSTSYLKEMGYKNLVITKRHPILFEDVFLKERFLLLGFEMSLNSLIQQNNLLIAHLYKQRILFYCRHVLVLRYRILYSLPIGVVSKLISVRDAIRTLKR